MIDLDVPGVCRICRRESRGFAYCPVEKRDGPVAFTCSNIECRELAMTTYGSIEEGAWTTREKTALDAMGTALEVYCDGIGKYDLRELSAVEFEELKTAQLQAYVAELRRAVREEAPF